VGQQDGVGEGTDPARDGRDGGCDLDRRDEVDVTDDVAVDDVDASVAKAKKAGGKLMRPIFDVPDVGRIAILMQPDGAGIAWMTPKPKA